MCIFTGLGLAGAAAAGGGFSTALQAIGVALGAFGSIASGVQANNVAQYNAKVAENSATAERERAGYEANMKRDEVRRVIGAQRAAGAASGLDITQGTPVAVLGDSMKSGELDVLARLYSGDAAATAYKNDANRFRAEGKAAQTAGFINAGTSLISGFGRMAAARRYNALGVG
jgi:hypothetical protein